ncbi:2-amino-4-hydroxy-6-hydroxymethyldihydropteridine pyrophosphokinase [Rhodoferax lithotrophicus]|uniref:2-amino-4-hydroxy-6-hydroxymethyldihydropteridine pyrophosphokinase n=1 Tax=Rhodoferax lithotrophicus TaxID=2798804 RepID=A0ABN6DA15_9BURK|nr:2-amino-4-hydroxy-6-hydroxymethyldihydropteridine diphosphokinase [Rhodoferax sp. MIZ03]BCO27741.1 2-amino-4-hydroxy-6-hydroxymethyldihydropteridine pyrophosphokinase [Rhodoferax sp. MIZ03]
MTESTCPEVVVYISLGANLGDAQATLSSCIDQLGHLPDCHLLACSSLYRSAPFEAVGPDFINAVIGLKTSMDAHELLLKLQHLENRAGRLRPYQNAPRTLDLDILLYGQASIQSPTLVVPHPRMWARAFVILPLAEIAPHLVSPAQLAAVASQSIARL